MESKNELTLEYLIENYSNNVCEGIEYAKSKYPECDIKLTGSDVQIYVNNLTELDESIQPRIKEINITIQDFIKHISGLNKVPEKYRGSVYIKACLEGHSNGFYGIYQELCKLVTWFS